MKKLLVAVVAMTCACAWATDYVWNGGSGEWTTEANWTPNTGYPNGAGDTASFAVDAVSSVTVASAVAVKGVTVTGTAKLMLTGSAITLGADGIVSTSTAAVDVSNAIAISAEETPFVNSGSLDASVGRTIAGPFHFRGVISGAGGISKSGQGYIHLYCDNPFEGPYKARGNQYMDEGWPTTLKAAYRTTFQRGSSDTYIYHCGALGRTSADFNGSAAEQLIICSAGTIDIPIVPSLSMSNKGIVSGWTISNGSITVQDFTGDLIFNKPVTASTFYTLFDIRCAANVHFMDDVWTLYGRNHIWFNSSGAHVYFHHPLKSLEMNNGLAAGVQLESDASFSDVGFHLCGSPVPAASTYYINQGAQGNVPVSCEAENVLPPWIMEVTFGDNGYFDLKGFEQLVRGGSRGATVYLPMQGASAGSDIKVISGATKFGFTSSTGDAKIRFAGTTVRSFAFPGAFVGGAGCEWDPQGDQTLTLSGNQVNSTGEFDVKSGKLMLTDGYAIASLASFKVAANAVAEIDATAATDHKVYAMDLASGGTGGLKLAQGVEVRVNTLTIDGGEPLPAGTYTKDSEELSGTLTGDGVIEVALFGIPCEWTGGATGDWNDPDNWSAGKVPDETHEVTIGAAAVTVSGAVPKVCELILDDGATLVFDAAASCVEADRISVLAGGRITTAGAFTDEVNLLRVWLKCGDLRVAEGGSIDVSRRGFMPKNGTSGSGDGTGPGQPGWWFAGATHGGRGAFIALNYTETIKYPYGDPLQPSTAGSSGQSCQNGFDVSGGGVVRIEATGRVTVDGSILANGGSTKANWDHYETAGAGGSIWITAASVGGTGTIAAEGGKGASPDLPLVRYYNRTNGYDHYPAGGGRIAIYVDATAQAANPATGLYVSAAEGTYQGRGETQGYLPPARGFADADWNCYGAEPGTVYLSDSSLLYQLVGSGLSGRLVGVQALTFAGDKTFTRGHVRSDVEGFTVTVGGNLTLDGDTRLDVGGVAMTNRMLKSEVWAGRSLNRITVGGNLTLRNGGALEINAAETNATMKWGGEVLVTGSVTVGAGGRLIATCDQMNLGAPHFAVGGDFTVAEGGVVSADGRGGLGGCYHAKDVFPINRNKGFGPGAGTGMGAGGYGGLGGYGGVPGWGTTEENRGKVYGDAWMPDMCGSGGGNQGQKISGSGGGLVFVEAGGDMTIDGTVTANGLGSWDSLITGDIYRPQSGSGGGIYLCANTFAGGASAVICANGGEAINVTDKGTAAPGGGGRVAVRTGYAKQLAGAKVKIVKVGNEIPGFSGTVVANAGACFKPISQAAQGLFFPENYRAPEDGTVRYSNVIDAPGLLLLFR